MAASLVAASHLAARGERKGARDCTLKGQSLHDFGERSNVTRYPRYQDTLLIYVGGGRSSLRRINLGAVFKGFLNTLGSLETVGGIVGLV